MAMLRVLLAATCLLLWSCTPPASGGWRNLAPMIDVHESFGALALPDGGVLVVGGHFINATHRRVDTVEVYDAVADRWTKTASMLETREGVGAMHLLSNGRVLVSGEHNTRTGSELFDFTTMTWTATGSLNVGRGSHVSALLNDGRVLVAGGIDWLSPNTPCFDSAELYDPSSGRWTLTSAMRHRRNGAMGAKLADGRVMVMGGYEDESSLRFLRSAEIFDPTRGTWTLTSEASREIGNAGMVRLSDGRVLLAGGVTRVGGKDTSRAEAEIYDPATDTWAPTGSMATPRSQFPLLLLDDGRVLAVGGVLRPQGKALAEAETFDPTSGTWSPAGRLAVQRWNHRVLRVGRQVLVLGGYNASGQLGSVEANDSF